VVSGKKWAVIFQFRPLDRGKNEPATIMQDKKKQLIWVVAADYLVLNFLTLGLLITLFWQDWVLLPVNALPGVFWLIYTVTCLFVLLLWC
jgi:hypothetical protein